MEFYNDNNVPHGGFIANFNNAGFLKVESFRPSIPGKVINRPDEVGSPNGWAGVTDQETATGTVQIPTSAGNGVRLGDFFVDTVARHSYKWAVVGIDEEYESGNYWKSQVRFQRSIFT